MLSFTTRPYPQQVIAEPTEETIVHFTRIVQSITASKRVIPTFQGTIHVFLVQEPLTEALSYMKHNGFSQVVAHGQSGLSLLSIEGVALWFAEQLQPEMNIARVTIADALAHEHPDNVLFLACTALVDDARVAFTETPTRSICFFTLSNNAAYTLE